MSAITEQHHAFARAVVAIAREHKMDNLRVNFKDNFESNFLGEDISFSWSSGRHGDRANIRLECRAMIGIDELAAGSD